MVTKDSMLPNLAVGDIMTLHHSEHWLNLVSWPGVLCSVHTASNMDGFCVLFGDASVSDCIYAVEYELCIHTVALFCQ